MPVYEYRCAECTAQFEELILGSETPVCPSCDSEQLTRLISTFGVSDGASDPGPLYSGPSGACGPCGDPAGPGACSPN